MKTVAERFGEAEIVPGLDLAIADGEVALSVGPSGCRTSTLLRPIAGLDDTSGGTIEIVVLNKGAIEQVGWPLELYSRPAKLFAAGFIGFRNIAFRGFPFGRQRLHHDAR